VSAWCVTGPYRPGLLPLGLPPPDEPVPLPDEPVPLPDEPVPVPPAAPDRFRMTLTRDVIGVPLMPLLAPVRAPAPVPVLPVRSLPVVPVRSLLEALDPVPVPVPVRSVLLEEPVPAVPPVELDPVPAPVPDPVPVPVPDPVPVPLPAASNTEMAR